jgi:hypothetical protein
MSTTAIFLTVLIAAGLVLLLWAIGRAVTGLPIKFIHIAQILNGASA